MMQYTRVIKTTQPMLAASWLVLLSACSTLTLEDFAGMEMQHRAEFVCLHKDHIKAYKQPLSHTQERIDDIDATINKGYRRAESCAVTIVTVTQEVCEQVTDALTQKATTQCSTVKTPAISEDCKQVNVPVSADYQQQQRQDLNDKRTFLYQQQQQAFAACVKKVSPMTPEQAYRYHKMH